MEILTVIALMLTIIGVGYANHAAMSRRMDELLQTIQADIESRFVQIESRLEQIESRLEQIESRLDRVESRLDRLEGALINLGVESLRRQPAT